MDPVISYLEYLAKRIFIVAGLFAFCLFAYFYFVN